MPIPVDIVDDASKVEEFRVTVEKRIQLKVIKSLRDWMKQYWDEDMVHDLELQKELCLWLDELKRVGAEKEAQCPWIRSLSATVQKEYDRFKVHSPGQDKRVELAKWTLEPETGVPLALKDVSIKKGFKLSNITAEELAEQITLMDFATFSRIGSRECIGQCWKKKKEESPNVLAMIRQVWSSHKSRGFVCSRIVREFTLYFGFCGFIMFSEDELFVIYRVLKSL